MIHGLYNAEVAIWNASGWLHIRGAILWGSAWRGLLYFVIWRRRRNRVLSGPKDQTMSRWTRRQIDYRTMPGAKVRLDQKVRH